MRTFIYMGNQWIILNNQQNAHIYIYIYMGNQWIILNNQQNAHIYIYTYVINGLF